MATGVIIPADIESAVRQQQFSDLHDYQAAVGSLIEAIDLGHPPMSFFANEEAKLIGLPINQPTSKNASTPATMKLRGRRG